MPDTPDPLRRGAFIDRDSDDSFLDLPEPRYQPHGRTMSDQDIENAADPEWRRQHGLGPLPAWPRGGGPAADA